MIFTATTTIISNSENFIGLAVSIVEYDSSNKIFGRIWRGIRNATRFVANAVITVVNVAISAVVIGVRIGIVSGLFASFVAGPAGFLTGFLLGLAMGVVIGTYEAISRNRCYRILGYTQCYTPVS